MDRANAAEQLANKALDLDGSKAARDVASLVALCPDPEETCVELAKNQAGTSKTGASAGIALNFARRGARRSLVRIPDDRRDYDITFAEKVAHVAVEEAQKVADGRGADQQRAQAEREAVGVLADNECKTSIDSCNAKCDGGSGSYCAAIGVVMLRAEPPKLSEAKMAMQKGCNAGFASACNGVVSVDKEIQAAASRVDTLWRDVTEVGDDIAVKHQQMAMMAKIANRPHLVLQLQQMRTITAAMIPEKYCPAKKDFITATSGAEFTKRASQHCKNEPPTATGLSGAEVTLTVECTQVYATSCP